MSDFLFKENPPTTESVSIGSKSVDATRAPERDAEVAGLKRELEIQKGECAECHRILTEQDAELAEVKRQLASVTKERDELKRMLHWI